MKYLHQREGEAVPREDMLRALWGVQNRSDTRTLDNHVARLRRKIEQDPKHPNVVLTVPGIGYRLSPGRVQLRT